MSDSNPISVRERWARFRYSVVGPLFAAPPETGELKAILEALAVRTYKHPTTEEAVHFGFSTIERWYYEAKNAPSDPIEALARKVPTHAGAHPSMPEPVLKALLEQYRQHPSWSMKLHFDNLGALARSNAELGVVPSYNTVCRVMKSHAMVRQRRQRVRTKEQRSFEVPHVHGLWHSDFHDGSRRVLVNGGWVTPRALAFLDDRSRLACHLQWFLDANAEAVAHGFTQAILKRGLPRGFLCDNGGAFVAAEITEGLAGLGIIANTTLPFSPEQNGKQESFWGQLEGRLLAMLEGEQNLTLELLNTATQAWVELEYNQAVHSELGMSPIACVLANKGVERPAPSVEDLRRSFRMRARRRQRRSDGTLTIEGIRFEVPARYRTLVDVAVRYARWDLSTVELIDPRSGKHLCDLFPLDRQKNADRRRRVLEPIEVGGDVDPVPSGIAPRLKELMAEYAATGLPPAYLPLNRPDEGDLE